MRVDQNKCIAKWNVGRELSGMAGTKSYLHKLLIDFSLSVFPDFSFQTSIQNLQVVLQHAAAGRARPWPWALHHPHGFRGAVLLHWPLRDDRRGAREAGRKKELLWRRSYRRSTLAAILISRSLKAAWWWTVRGVSSDKCKHKGFSHV